MTQIKCVQQEDKTWTIKVGNKKPVVFTPNHLVEYFEPNFDFYEFAKASACSKNIELVIPGFDVINVKLSITINDGLIASARIRELRCGMIIGNALSQFAFEHNPRT